MILQKRFVSLIFLVALAVGCNAFVGSWPTTFLPSPGRRSKGFSTSQRVASGDLTEIAPIKITGNNVQVTDALQDYVDEKLEKSLSKFKESRLVNEIACDVHLSVNKNPAVKEGHTCEVVTILAGGPTIRVEETTADMYSSIDLVSDRLARKLRKFKERKLDGYHGGLSIGEDSANALNELLNAEADDEDSFDSTAGGASDSPETRSEVPEITKIKSFDLSKPISIEEAVFALDYIDHDFYVFRDQATNEISVVYKRNAGGVGLIQPSD